MDNKDKGKNPNKPNKPTMRRIEIMRENSGEGLRQDILDLGLKPGKIEVLDVYLIYGDITAQELSKLKHVVADPVSDRYGEFSFPENTKILEIALNPGVMDPVAIDTQEVAKRLGITIDGIRILKKYVFYNADDETVRLATERVIFNPLIQHIVRDEEKLEVDIRPTEETPTVDLSSMNDKELQQSSRKMGLFLNLEEMIEISDYFSRESREPTIAELETFGILWSEHCSHKTMRGKVTLCSGGKGKIYCDSLLKSTVMKVTEELRKPWVISAFKDNAGIIEFDGRYAVCFKVETHNHPSALEPFGGAATGIGGVIRDILGCGLGAKPIANTDIFCVGDPGMPYSELPRGVLHPRRILRGIVSGVADYGNKMGIPTVNGSVTFHRDYTANPLVYCGCIGIIPKNRCDKSVKVGDLVVLVGGKTGRDGIHGATFSSGIMDETTQSEFGSAVQIGDPLREKNLLDALLVARDRGLYNSITDCGAGGICTAVSELAEGIGAEIQLDKVQLKYTGLVPTEIWVSESQERMVLAAPEKNIEALKSIFDEYESELTVIGRFVDTRRIKVRCKESVICNLDLDFLLHGMPKNAKKAIFPSNKGNKQGVKVNSYISSNVGVEELLERMMSHQNIATKEWVVRQYDHEVQGATCIKPLHADAAVLCPLFIECKRCIVVAHGLTPFYEDPYRNAASSLDEAVRNLCAAGGDPSLCALLDNFSWGDPEDPITMGKLVRACEALYDVAMVYKMPFISGKDSLYNEYKSENGKISVPPTILVSAISIIDDINTTVSQSIKGDSNLIYVVGHTYPELGNSLLYRVLGHSGGEEPILRSEIAIELYKRLHKSIKSGIVMACHDCSEGGIGVALPEMCFDANLGMEINLEKIPASDLEDLEHILFSESNSRFVVEVDPAREKEFEEVMSGTCVSQIGRVISSYELIFNEHIIIPVSRLERAWRSRKL